MTEGPMKVVHLEPKRTQPAKIVYISEEKLKEEPMEPKNVSVDLMYEETVAHYTDFDLISVYVPKGRLWNTTEEASNVVRGMMTTGDKLTATLLQIDMNVERDFFVNVDDALPVRVPCVMLKFKKKL